MASSKSNPWASIQQSILRFPKQGGPDDDRFWPPVSGHPMLRVAKIASLMGTQDDLAAAATHAIEAGKPISDWTPFAAQSQTQTQTSFMPTPRAT